MPKSGRAMVAVPIRQVRALFDDRTVTVYQAYSPAIADPALAAGRFVPPFKLGRMTWVKPSFLWMMYRSSWATKPGQERVLAVSITREGFEWALAHSSLSHYDPAVYANAAEWTEYKETMPTRVQWDPERSLQLEPLEYRSLQVGLSREAARRYVNDWTTNVTDVTSLAQEIHSLVKSRRTAMARTRLPAEHPYPVPGYIETAIGAG